jgi:hypothetical protein
MAAVGYFQVMFNTFYTDKTCTYVLPKMNNNNNYLTYILTTASSKYFT